MMRFSFIVIAAILFLFVPTSRAVEIVVNGRVPSASDKNPGTVAQPLRTIQAAVEKARAGDRVIVHGGDYREAVVITESGTAEAPIVIEAAAGATSVIKGSEIVTGWTLDEGAVWKATLPAASPRSGDNKNPAYWNSEGVGQLFASDGVLLDAVHLRKVGSRKDLRPGTFYADQKGRTLFAWLPDSQSPAKRTMEASVRGAWLYVMGSHVTIRSLQMRHAYTLAHAPWPACNLVGEGNVIEDCTITWGDFVGFSMSGRGGRISRCLVACHGNSGINAAGEGHAIEECKVLYNNLDRYSTGWHCGGAKLVMGFAKGRIQRNEFACNIGPGLWLDGNCNDNLIDGNFCHDNEGPGIMVEISSGNTVSNNLCVGNRNLGAGEYLDLNPDAGKNPDDDFRLIRRGADARSERRYNAGEGRGIYISSSPATKVFHNTCSYNQGEGICVEGPVRDSYSTRDCRVYNNISVWNQGVQLVVRKNGIDEHTAGNDSDFNLIIATGAIFAAAGWNSPATWSLPEWQESSGWDGHSVEADPHFAMGAMNDYRLQPESPALRTGKSLPEVGTDFDGNPRSPDSTALGAFSEATGDYPRESVLTNR